MEDLRCDPHKPFGADVAITELNTPALEDGVWLSSDERTIYFSSTRDGSFDIYTATPKANELDARWTGIRQLENVNTTGMMERGPVVTPDGLALYATRQIGSDYNVLIATRTSTSERFGAFDNDPALNAASPDIDDSPSAILEDRTILFESSRSGNADLYQATWDGAKYSQIAMLGGLEYTDPGTHMRSIDGGPKLTADGLTLYFTSNRGSLDPGDFNVWSASRLQASGPFSNPMKLGFNTDALEAASWISADGCVIYFLRQVAPPGQPPDYDVYKATKPL